MPARGTTSICLVRKDNHLRKLTPQVNILISILNRKIRLYCNKAAVKCNCNKAAVIMCMQRNVLAFPPHITPTSTTNSNFKNKPSSSQIFLFFFSDISLLSPPSTHTHSFYQRVEYILWCWYILVENPVNTNLIQRKTFSQNSFSSRIL